MAARKILWSLSFVIALGVLCMGTAAGQDSIPSNSEPNSTSADNSSSPAGAVSPDADVATAINDPTNTNTPIKKVGTPFPLTMDPGGYRIGPFHLTNVSTSGFYTVATPPGQSSQTLLGTSVAGQFAYVHPVRNGLLAIQANPEVSVSNGSAYVNSMGGIDFSKQLTARWSMTISAQWTFYQNEYLLQTPQYLLAYAAGGIVLQHVYAQRNGSTTYESNAFAMNYQISGRTQLSLSPTANTSFADVDGTSDLVAQLGGGATLTHSFTPGRSGFVYGNLTHAFSRQPQISGETAWLTYSIGGGFNQAIGTGWYLGGSVGASHQSGIASPWVPTGTASLMKAFHNGSISAAYSRSTATEALLSSGYFDQVDLAFVRQIGRKIGTSVGVGAFRSIETGSHNHGRRAYASLSYNWRPNLAWSFLYAYSNQDSSETAIYSGRTNYISVGLQWRLGHPAAR